MFTGLIEEIGRIDSSRRSKEDFKLSINGQEVNKELALGDSIAVNGVCLTVSNLGTGGQFEVDVMPETMHSTNLKELSAGSPVNLERALQAGSRLGGHFVNGHVDGTVSLLYRRPEGNAVIMGFTASPELLKYIVKKGSVAVDGVSLTVAEISAEGFSVSLVPHTLNVTTLGEKKVGAQFNLEVDILGKYVEKYLEKFLAKQPEEKKEAITEEFLREKGF